MYRIGDKRSAVIVIQRFLREIYNGGEFLIPRVSVDGIYGDETKNAVAMYQSAKRIAPSGTVDFETQALLFDDYLYYKEINNSNKTILGDGIFPYNIGDRGNDVSNINNLLRQLTVHYTDMPTAPRSDFYTTATSDAVKYLQSILLMRSDGIMDALLYVRLLELNDSLNKIKERNDI